MKRSSQELLLILLALAFTTIGCLSLWLQTGNVLPLATIALIGILGGLTHLWLNRVAPERDALIFPATLLLTAWGFLVLHRVAQNFVIRQAAWMLVGLVVLALVTSSRDHLRWLRRFRYTWLLASLVLLFATLIFGQNPSGEGARLWLGIAGVYIQPSEVLRLLLVAFLAAFFAEKAPFSHWQQLHDSGSSMQRTNAKTYTLRSALTMLVPLAPSIVMWLAALALLISQQDLGAAMLLLISYAFLLYLATGKAWLSVTGIFMLIAAVAIGYFVSPRVALRLSTWLNPWLDPQGSSFQIVQSLISIASGSLFGQGIGQGSPGYVPAVHTDFPFAAIGEEYGLIGIIGNLTLYAVLCLRAWRIAHQSKSAYTLLLSGGIAALLTTQLFVIVGGNLGIIPLTGVTLPFVSYGGSSLLVSFIAVGLLLRISADQNSTHHENANAQPYQVTCSRATLDTILQATPAQNKAAARAAFISASLIICLALAGGYWSIWQASGITTRDDNPRKLDTERAIDRGTILASDGRPLVQSLQNTAQDLDTRARFSRSVVYPQAASVVGFYSYRYGLSGLELYGDKLLRGTTSDVDALLHRTQHGSALHSTINISQQLQLADALQGSKGAGVVMDWRSGEILALASSPTFDPNRLDEDWEKLSADTNAPLLNRVTQGLYQPGVLLNWMYQSDDINFQPDISNWDVGDKFDLGKPVQFELKNASVPYPASGTLSETTGQGTLRITPLRLSVVAASLAAGQRITPTLLPNKGTIVDLSSPRFTVDKVILAQSGASTYVGWYIRITDKLVTVLAIELPSASTNTLYQIRNRLTPLSASFH